MYRRWITQIRLSSQNLCIDSRLRMCIMWDKNEEENLILQCTNYTDIR